MVNLIWDREDWKRELGVDDFEISDEDIEKLQQLFSDIYFGVSDEIEDAFEGWVGGLTKLEVDNLIKIYDAKTKSVGTA